MTYHKYYISINGDHSYGAHKNPLWNTRQVDSSEESICLKVDAIHDCFWIKICSDAGCDSTSVGVESWGKTRAFAIPGEELWNGSSRKFEFFAPPGCRWRIEAICHYFAFDIKRGGAKEMIPHAFACVRDAAAERERGCASEDIEYWSIMDGANNTLTWCDANFHKAPFDSARELSLWLIKGRKTLGTKKNRLCWVSERVCRAHTIRRREKVAASADIAQSLLAEIVFAEFTNSSVRFDVGAIQRDSLVHTGEQRQADHVRKLMAGKNSQEERVAAVQRSFVSSFICVRHCRTQVNLHDCKRKFNINIPLLNIGAFNNNN